MLREYLLILSGLTGQGNKRAFIVLDALPEVGDEITYDGSDWLVVAAFILPN